MVKELGSTAEFNECKAQSHNQLLVVDFFATWCGPCIGCAPKFQALSEKYQDVIFVKADVDKLSDLSKEVGVRAMPTFIFFKGGNKVKEVVGADMRQIEEAIVQLK